MGSVCPASSMACCITLGKCFMCISSAPFCKSPVSFAMDGLVGNIRFIAVDSLCLSSLCFPRPDSLSFSSCTTSGQADLTGTDLRKRLPTDVAGRGLVLRAFATFLGIDLKFTFGILRQVRSSCGGVAGCLRTANLPSLAISSTLSSSVTTLLTGQCRTLSDTATLAAIKYCSIFLIPNYLPENR